MNVQIWIAVTAVALLSPKRFDEFEERPKQFEAFADSDCRCSDLINGQTAVSLTYLGQGARQA